MGVGGLPLTVTYLTVFHPELPHHIVQGTAMVSMIPSIITSAVSYAASGHTPLAIAGALTCGSSAGALFGASVALRLSDETLRSVYMASLVVLGGRSLVAACRNVRVMARHGAQA
jgi:uncharacterized membrane protein YfcA